MVAATVTWSRRCYSPGACRWSCWPSGSGAGGISEVYDDIAVREARVAEHVPCGAEIVPPLVRATLTESGLPLMPSTVVTPAAATVSTSGGDGDFVRIGKAVGGRRVDKGHDVADLEGDSGAENSVGTMVPAWCTCR